MNNTFKLLLIISLLFLTCKSSVLETFPNPTNIQFRVPDSINTRMNGKFVKSRKSFVGKVEEENLDKLYNSFENYLKTKVYRDKSVLINYNQRGNNCTSMTYENLIFVTDNIKRISNRMSKNHSIQDFFMFSKTAYNRDVYENIGYYIEDSGFFKKEIFTLEEVCNAFFLIKPNGEFLKFYGSDYFSEVKKFMESELVFSED
jgi:hypothetical protein